MPAFLTQARSFLKNNPVAVVCAVATLCVVGAGAYLYHSRTPSEAVPQAVSGPITCQPENGTAKLTSAQIFDGPPSEEASLAPDDETAVPQTWSLSEPAVSKDGYVLACSYGTSGTVITRPIPTGKTCTGRNDQNLVCS